MRAECRTWGVDERSPAGCAGLCRRRRLVWAPTPTRMLYQMVGSVVCADAEAWSWMFE